ncbi:MAG: anti-sigma factor [Candidatus Eremiobacteraeota bacterium]|nr:anti-sigma factor [Candidatus Eremiobacteraeota bacterium]
MIVHDDSFSESIAVLALGALPQSEATEVAAHVRTCDSCRREYAELRSVADLIGYAAELRPGELDEVTAARMKSRVMRGVRGDVPAAQPAASRKVRANQPLTWVAALAAAAVGFAVLSSVDNADLRSKNAATERRLALVQHDAGLQAVALADGEARQRMLEARLSEILVPGAKHFTVPSGEVIEAHGRLLIALSRLPKPPNGKVYQAWTLARGSKEVAPSITFAPDASGAAVIELLEPAANLAAVAVTVEPSGGSKSPTSKPRFLRTLS